LKWIHPVLLWTGIIRPSEEGCLASLFTAASAEFEREMSGSYFNEKAVEMKPSAAAMDTAERERLEKWTVEKMKTGRWIQ
jgi:hypothetical protein